MRGGEVLSALTLLLLGVASASIHKSMNIDELRSTFHVDSHDLVPEYQVVNIHHISTRSVDASGYNQLPLSTGKILGKVSEEVVHQAKLRTATADVRLKAFGRPLRLSLTRNDGLLRAGSGLKLYAAEPNATAHHGVEYVHLPPEAHEDIGDIYQDQENEAAILLRNDEKNGELLMEGSIGGDLVIRPIPTHLRDDAVVETDISDDEMYLDQEGDMSGDVSIDTGLPLMRKKITTKLAKHIVYKKPAKEDKEETDYAFMEPDHMAKRFRRKKRSTESTSRSKREAPYIIYPEILVIVDYDGYRLHGGDNVQIKRYFVSFWNGVDLRYKLLKGPKIRISIAGIIISRGRDATPYLERNRVGRDAIDSAAALTDMGKYLFRERRLPVYDIAVAITKYDMCRRRKGGRCTKGTAGFAYVGGACVVNKRLEKVNSVAIIEDTGGFSGIIVAAHEVGHLLGAVHDGSPPPSYLGGPGAEKCRWEDGFIMSDLRHTERGFRWSPCSVSSFHHFLNGDTATCLYNSPHEDDGLPRVLPGKLLSLDAQCRKDRGTSACFKDDRVCAQLFCFDSGSGYCVAYRPAAEGSPCGDGQYCLNGRCVAEHENIIPDYSQNTPSYVRRQDDNQGRPLFYDDEEDASKPPQQPYQPYSSPRLPPTTTTTTTPPSSTTTRKSVFQFFTTKPTTTTKYPTTRNPFFTTTRSYSTTTTTTTKRPYYQTTPNPFQTTRKSTTKSSFFTYRPQSTTKSPYDFKHFGRQSGVTTTTTTRPAATTKNPYIGDYYLIRSKTTKSPYDFANFGRTTRNYDDINNNYLKRSAGQLAGADSSQGPVRS